MDKKMSFYLGLSLVSLVGILVLFASFFIFLYLVRRGNDFVGQITIISFFVMLGFYLFSLVGKILKGGNIV
ncbi:MAG: hypothetical protein N3D73_01770 [Candidatus Diapherotrites archaeon]|nr:hypothetical protein [Candidatus Diapherotrites archaeon]